MTVAVRVQGNQGSSTSINVGPTDANGYAQTGCGGQYSYPQSEQLTIGTDPVANPPGGVPADALTHVNVDTSGASVCQ
jgi:hypothetical protein